jgi:hypothetical protein
VIVAGLDTASRRAVLVVPALGMAAEAFVRPSTPQQEVHELAGWVAHSLPPGTHLFVERSIYVQNAQTCVRLAMTVGAVLARWDPALTTLVDIPVWKQQVVGHGHAVKGDVARWLAGSHPDLAALCASQDLVDAACIALYGRMCLAGPEPDRLPDYEGSDQGG